MEKDGGKLGTQTLKVEEKGTLPYRVGVRGDQNVQGRREKPKPLK